MRLGRGLVENGGSRSGYPTGAGFDVMTTLLLGSVAHGIDDPASGKRDAGRDLFYGGVVSLLYDW